MAEPDVVRVAREYREQLARNEDAALKRMSRFWVKMERGLMADYQALAQEVLDRKAAGMPVPRQFMYTMERYRSMMEQIQKEMPYYQTTVEDLIKQYQSKNYQLGIDGANEIIKAAHPSSDVWTKVYKDAAETAAGFAGNGAPLHDLLQTDYGASSERILDSLVSGVGLGKGYKEIARDMADAMAYDYDRSMRIARTEINRSYRLANAEQYRRSGVVEKVLRLCFKPTACFACLEMDGEECPRGICEDHPNGKCTTIVVTTGGVVPDWEKGSEWLMYQSEEDQRRIMGEGRFDLWKNFGVDPRDMVYMKPNDVWGAAPAVKTFEMMGYGARGSILKSYFSAGTGEEKKSSLSKEVHDEIVNNGRKTLNFTHHLDQMGINASRMEPDEGFQDVVIHGDRFDFAFRDPNSEDNKGGKYGNEETITAAELAQFVLESNIYAGSPIRLIACDAGNLGAISAQDLSDLLQVPVKAPTEIIKIAFDGTYRIESESGRKKGEWRVIQPKPRSNEN